jgi:hypothetical protein
MLRSLQLINCSIDKDAVEKAAHSLARLPYLKALTLQEAAVPYSIAAELTGLTSLIINPNRDVPFDMEDGEPMLRVAGHNPGLVRLELGGMWCTEAPHQFSLLSTCTNLIKLDISGGEKMAMHWTYCWTTAPASLTSP